MLSGTILNARTIAVNITDKNPIIMELHSGEGTINKQEIPVIYGAKASTRSMLVTVMRAKVKNKIEKGNGKYRGVCYFSQGKLYWHGDIWKPERVMDSSILVMWNVSIPGRGNPGTDEAGDLPYVLEEQYSESKFFVPTAIHLAFN